TSWVYSSRTGGFVNKVIEWSKTKTELRIVDDQIGSPTWCRTLAEVTGQVIAQYALDKDRLQSLSGLYHLAGAGSASRYEWVKEILRLTGREAITVLPAKTTEFPAPAVRPMNSGLECGKSETLLGYILPPWKTALYLSLS
ncbi:MAG: SDR family oxidoreductase, partial [Bellilinea sp.]